MISEKLKTDLVRRFFSGTGTTYDQIVNLCTLGFDRLWKQKIIEKIPQGSLRIMDQACGTGILTIRIARRFPQSRIIGVDVTEEYLRIARMKVQAQGLGNVEFVLGRAEEVQQEGGLDCITSSYLAKYAEMETLVGNIKTMLRDGGRVIMHDFTYPSNRVFARLWGFYFKLLQTLGSWKYPHWKTVFAELPGFLKEADWTNELVNTLQEKGFSDITVESLTWGTAAIVTARKE
jgi:demethylmenaquinone methyltransferase/2-methoxy-6-polyprenyl-1,4-benzoquinol methylase